MKWKDGFVRRRCQCTCYTKGYTLFARRCRECRYNESATPHTVFHKLKFSIQKAFNSVFRYSRKKGMSTFELARELSITQKSAWLFHIKIQQAMASSGKHLLTGEVHIDEFITGGLEPLCGLNMLFYKKLL